MSKRYPPEVRDKALRLALDHLDEPGRRQTRKRRLKLKINLKGWNTKER